MIITSTIHTLTKEQKTAVFDLWNNEYPAQLAYREMAELEGYLEGLPNQKNYFAMGDNDTILGWAFVFDRDDERWFAIIVNGAVHGRGIGSLMLNKLKSDEKQLSGWVTDHGSYALLNGAPYISPLEFYFKNGFTVKRETRLEIDVLSAVKIQWRDSNPANGPK